MGTTVSAAWFHDGKVSIAHIGDSRIYRYRDYRLELLTTDHTVVQELVDHGFYTRKKPGHQSSEILSPVHWG